MQNSLNPSTGDPAQTPPAKKRRIGSSIALGLLVAIMAFVALVMSRPNSFHVERSREIAAPPEMIFAMVNDLHQWSRWSPFEKLDPNMQKTYDGPEAGPGASLHWSGNSQAGEGRMTILDSRDPERIAIKLEFLRPFQATNMATFVLAPVDGKTRITWNMDGDLNFFMKVIHLFLNMDQLLGKDFDEGLANLDRIVHEAEKTDQ